MTSAATGRFADSSPSTYSATLARDEADDFLQVSEARTRSLFLDFMTKLATLDEMVDSTKRILTKYHQELEYFRRPQIFEASSIASEIIKSHYTKRMQTYIEAGCNHHHQSIQNISQLGSCEKALKSYLNKAELLLRELQSLSEDAYTLAARKCASWSPQNDQNNLMLEDPHDSEIEEKPSQIEENGMSYVCLMRLVHNMLRLDYAMQEKIISSLNLNTSSEELESYCLMWDLRPFVDDDIIKHAWKFVPG